MSHVLICCLFYFQSVVEYIEDLELRTDMNGATIAPATYHCRFRVGRGGRLIMDRIPVSDHFHLIKCLI